MGEKAGRWKEQTDQLRLKASLVKRWRGQEQGRDGKKRATKSNQKENKTLKIIVWKRGFPV